MPNAGLSGSMLEQVGRDTSHALYEYKFADDFIWAQHDTGWSAVFDYIEIVYYRQRPHSALG